MKSVKGMTWGTPEFTEIAKAAEREGETEYEAEQLLDELESLNMTAGVRIRTREHVAMIFELCTGDCEW